MTAKPRFILVETSDPLNAGAAARALASTAAGELWLVRPRFDFNDARRTAVGATDILATARIAKDLDVALPAGALVVATESGVTAGRTAVTPRALPALAPERPLAILFGHEVNGLPRELIDRCDVVSRIPAAGKQPSYNLAQAVLLYAYELMLAARPQPISAKPRLPASNTEALERTVAEFAVRIGLVARAPAVLRSTLLRAQLSPREARLWTAALTRAGSAAPASSSAAPRRRSTPARSSRPR